MDYRRNNSNIGDQIRNSVEHAMDSMNFERLNHDITNSVNRALDETKRHLRGDGGSYNSDFYYNPYNSDGDRTADGNPYDRSGDRTRQSDYNQYGERVRNRHQHNHNRNRCGGYGFNFDFNFGGNDFRQRRNYSGDDPTLPAYIGQHYQGKVSGMLLKILGYTGTSLFGIAIFVLAILAALDIAAGVMIPIIVGLSPLLVLSLVGASRGNHIRKRIARFRQYQAIFDKQTFYSIDELAKTTGKSRKFVIKDLKKMITLRMFPQGHFDIKQTFFILDNKTYEQYLQAEQQLQNRQQQSKASEMPKKDEAKKADTKKTDSKKKVDNPDLAKAIDEGQEYIRQIKEANDAIPGVEISNKLYRLETVITKIFACVEEHPDQLPEIRKFMEYYLPTTLRLVNAYREFDAQPIQGGNIEKSKDEIQKTLDTINMAFEKLLDSLYEDAAMEVSSDISVLETLLAQEGLTKDDFK